MHAFRYFDTTRIAENKGLEWEFVLILARAARERDLAKAIRARKLIFLSDIPGVMRDPQDPSSVIGTIRRGDVEAMIQDGILSGGMIPKIRAAAGALDVCRKVHILDGRRPHGLLLELFTNEGIGTQIVR